MIKCASSIIVAKVGELLIRELLWIENEASSDSWLDDEDEEEEWLMVEEHTTRMMMDRQTIIHE